MVYEKWISIKRTAANPRCVFCDTPTELTIIFRSEEYIPKGWKCPKCGFTIIHPDEIPKALSLLKEIARI